MGAPDRRSSGPQEVDGVHRQYQGRHEGLAGRHGGRRPGQHRRQRRRVHGSARPVRMRQVQPGQRARRGHGDGNPVAARRPEGSAYHDVPVAGAAAGRRRGARCRPLPGLRRLRRHPDADGGDPGHRCRRRGGPALAARGQRGRRPGRAQLHRAAGSREAGRDARESDHGGHHPQARLARCPGERGRPTAARRGARRAVRRRCGP